jgi:hypothetical protein
MFSQLAFFQTYQGTNKKSLEPVGNCGWWLKHYFLSKAEEANEADLIMHASITRKQAKISIKSWFERNSTYPTRINCTIYRDFFNLANLFSRTLQGKNVFDLHSSRAEIKKIFEMEGIGENRIDDFIVGTCVIVSGKSVEIVPGFTASVELRVENKRSIPTGEGGRWPGDPRGWNVIMLPDGDLSVMVTTKNTTDDGLASVALMLLETKIDTEEYFSRSLVGVDKNGLPTLLLDGPLSFDASRTPKIESAS